MATTSGPRKLSDKEIEREGRRIVSFGRKWPKLLGLSSWDIKYSIVGEPGPQFNEMTTAFCVADWRYKLAEVQFNARETQRLSDDQLEGVFVHEMMHILLDQLESKKTDAEERVATELATAFIWTDRCRETTRVRK